jgi:hypothetical protein
MKMKKTLILIALLPLLPLMIFSATLAKILDALVDGPIAAFRFWNTWRKEP